MLEFCSAAELPLLPLAVEVLELEVLPIESVLVLCILKPLSIIITSWAARLEEPFML